MPNAEPLTLDPHANTSAISVAITSSIGETLLYLNERHELQPWLARAWEVRDSGATFIFNLRQDVTFQDGTAFNAAAVKWNFDRIVDPNFKAGQALSFLTGYQGADVIDDFTIRVRFGRPLVPFLEYAAGQQLAMLSPTATARQGHLVNRAPVMSGPYQVDEWIPRDHITLSRRDGYVRRTPWSDHDGAGSLDKVVWKFIPEAGTRVTTVETGETQLISGLTPQDASRLQSQGFSIVRTPVGGSPLSLLLNVTMPPTDDLRVRQAIAAALEPEVLLTTDYLGSPALGPLSAAVLDDPSLRALHRHDDARATQLLDQAGWTPGSDGIRQRNGQRLEFLLNAQSDAGTGSGVPQLLQAQLQQVGIAVTLKSQALAAYTQDFYRCATNGGLWNIRTGGVDILYQFFRSSNVGSNFNFSCLKDAEIDQALDQGRQEVDPTRRQQLYVQLELKLMDMAVDVPLVDLESGYAMRPNVTGLKFSGYGYPLLTDVSFNS